MDNVALMRGGCLELLQTVPDGSIDCVVTDPPYGINYVMNYRKKANDIARPVACDTPEEALMLWDATCAALKPKLKPDAHLYIFASWKNCPQFQAVTAKYFRIKNVLVWVKNNHGAGDLYGNYGDVYEQIIFATQGRRLLNGKRGENVLYCDKVPASKLRHSCEKPVPLLSSLVEKSTNLGDVVLDPFMGSGSTGVACANLHRDFVGIEIDEHNFDIAKTRIAECDHC